ncbi:MAG: hypothetical protein PHD00_01545 [Bacteroidales bacterium]|jgi:hypothetical protein|nr:hypothetical protein [Bacteroidales bacterium]MDD4671308.1 hypothetical protein [Bacteroidales bacterium]
MKKSIFILSVLIVFSSTSIHANNHQFEHNKKIVKQENEHQNSPFLDADYQTGKIIFKNGERFQANLNYHFPTNRICFIDENDEPFILVDLSEIVMVLYGDRVFTPIDKSKVAETLKIFSDGSRLLLQRHAKAAIIDDNSGAYGGSTMTSSVTKLTSMPFDGVFQKFEVDNNFKPVITEKFILMQDGKRYPISRLKSLKRAFRSKWKEIKKYAEQNNLDVKNREDLIDLLEFCVE